MSRSFAELMGLEYEAERLVRAGVSRAEVARRLGVHPQTLAGWALRGGWRKKDLDMERNAEITRKTLVAIREGNRAADGQDALRARMRVFMREAVELLAAADEAAMAELERRLAGVESLGRLEAPKVALEAHAPEQRQGGLGEAQVGRDPEQE
jgi:transposase-like protein